MRETPLIVLRWATDPGERRPHRRVLCAGTRRALAGVLRWAVEGCPEWQREGLQAPKEVRKATGQYRSEMDVIGAFLQDECEIGAGYRAPFADLYQRYETWCEEGGERAETRRKFNARLKERGQLEARRSGPGGANEWHGLRLLKKQTGAFAGKLKERSESSHNSSENTPSREKGENSFSSSVASVKTPTDEQRRRIHQLVYEGTSETVARREVLGDPSGHPLSCECEDCL
jgi:phage/plasmid-associated DNA primase